MLFWCKAFSFYIIGEKSGRSEESTWCGIVNVSTIVIKAANMMWSKEAGLKNPRIL
jgi:hypothetical protein